MKKLAPRTKKILWIGIAAILAVGIVLGVVLGTVYATTKAKLSDYLEIPMYALDEKFTSEVYRVKKYSGHPDLVLTGTGELITMFPAGHGKGAVISKSSTDGGKTWTHNQNTPASWIKSQETPTLYRLNFTDGSHKIIMTSGCPAWGNDPKYPINGFNFSYSDDEGKSWSEFENFYGQVWASMNEGKSAFDCIVAMSSLTRLKENGAYIDKWMGTFHDHNFDNYRTYLTFDDKGKASWSEPELLLREWNEIGREKQMCELEIARVQTGELVLLARSNVHTGPSLACVSTDEGLTWTKPVALPYALTGDRHKAEYDKKTDKWLITFRQVLPSAPHALSQSKIFGEGWVAWVGSDAVLLQLAKGNHSRGFGDAMILIGKNYKNNLDCGYAGTAINNDTFTVVSYGYFSKGVRYPYIMSATFHLKDVLPNV